MPSTPNPTLLNRHGFRQIDLSARPADLALAIASVCTCCCPQPRTNANTQLPSITTPLTADQYQYALLGFLTHATIQCNAMDTHCMQIYT